ncbi:MAG: RNA 2',3'-cyclic phosphodiesterase [Flavobacteriales bacterium]|nr:RNA 2',3'-cyclic phosphodiesterase [Flavobacteriales bacterium]
MSSAEHLRLFIGTSLDAGTRDHVKQNLPGSVNLADLRWLPAEQWHITTLFMGNWPADRLDEAMVALLSSATRTAPFMLRDGRACGMPEEGPTMLWVRFLPEPAHRQLHVALAGSLGLPPDERDPFWPHITLARGQQVPAVLGDLVLDHFRVEQLTLFRSDPAPQGTVHSPLMTVPLEG